MLKDEDRIFKNLYNDLGADLISAKKRGDWNNTKEICDRGREWIINEVKNYGEICMLIVLGKIVRFVMKK